MPINDPDNPLYGKEYRGGNTYKKYIYTVKDIAKVTGRAEGTIRNDVCSGALVIEDLGNVVGYCRRVMNERAWRDVIEGDAQTM